ncbi:hypothetical protein ACFW42_29505 [Streptomyces albidoflavus]
MLADDVTFEGPVAKASGVAECVAGLVEMGKMISGEQVEVRLADSGNVLTWSTVRAGAGRAGAADRGLVAGGRGADHRDPYRLRRAGNGGR